MSDFAAVNKIMNKEPNPQSGVGIESYDKRYVSAEVSNKGVNTAGCSRTTPGTSRDSWCGADEVQVDDMFIAKEHR